MNIIDRWRDMPLFIFIYLFISFHFLKEKTMHFTNRVHLAQEERNTTVQMDHKLFRKCENFP